MFSLQLQCLISLGDAGVVTLGVTLGDAGVELGMFTVENVIKAISGESKKIYSCPLKYLPKWSHPKN